MKEIDQIWADLQSKLVALDTVVNTIKRFALFRNAAWDAIERLEGFFLEHNEFEGDPAALINFNRNLAPPFYAKFLFFSKVSAFECLKMDMDTAEYEHLLELELADIKLFFRQHSEFRQYFLKGWTGRDGLYFQDANNPIHFDELVVGISPYVNSGCLLVAYIQAFEEYRNYLKAPVDKEKSGMTIDTDLSWAGEISDLNDLLIVLEGYIEKKGGRKATLKEIREAFGSFLHVNLTNGSQLDNKRRNLLNDGPGFLEKLVEKSKNRRNKLDDNQNSRRRRG